MPGGVGLNPDSAIPRSLSVCTDGAKVRVNREQAGSSRFTAAGNETGRQTRRGPEAAAKGSARLDRDREATGRFALRAFESADFVTRRRRLNARQPHRLAAFGARKDPDLCTAVYWIRLHGRHDASLHWAGAQHSQSPIKARGSAVIAKVYAGSAAAYVQKCT